MKWKKVDALPIPQKEYTASAEYDRILDEFLRSDATLFEVEDFPKDKTMRQNRNNLAAAVRNRKKDGTIKVRLIDNRIFMVKMI